MEKSKPTFPEAVKIVVRNIPRGTTLTYKEVAVRVGNPNAARAVARVMSTNIDPSVPCHRVIRSDGGLGGYNICMREAESLSEELRISLKRISYTIQSPDTGIDIKRKVLQNEGVAI